MKKLIQTTLLFAVCAACSHQSKTTEAAPVVTTDPTVSSSATPTVTTAQALMKPGKNQKAQGIVHFTQSGDKLKIHAMLEKVKPGPHGVHIHETGDCSAADFSSAGGHFNPGHSGHGSLTSTERHAGDLGNITATAKGSAKISLEVSGLSLNGPNSVVGKALVVHAKADDFKSQPAGDSGDRIACGVIEAN